MTTTLAELRDASTDEVLTMVLGQDDDILFGADDITIGRMPVGMDESDFDAMPPHRYDFDYTEGEGEQGDELDILSGSDGEDETPAPFKPPAEEKFPVFKKALRHFRAAERPARVVRIDTDETYGDFICEKAVKEIARRVDELRAAIEEHASDEHGGKMQPMRKWEVLGAAQAVSKLQSAKTTKEAADALPKVPVDVPAFAEGKVKCWRDGENVLCSMRFAAADGTPRVMTMAGKPKVSADSVVGWAMRSGVDPITVLGVLPDLADVACGKRLVRDVAGAALQAQRRLDVCGMSDEGTEAEPVLLTSEGTEGSAPLAALMYVEQQAEVGDPQAQVEMAVIRKAAETPSGQRIAMPLLAEVDTRLARGRAKKRRARSLFQRFFPVRYL